jgi:Zn-dependent membrane protease YugP
LRRTKRARHSACAALRAAEGADGPRADHDGGFEHSLFHLHRQLVLALRRLFKIGFWCFLALAAFQVITLPVEFDASARAKVILQNMGFIRSGEEVAGVNRVLDAAALTYVAALVATIGNLIYFFLLSRDRE